MKTIIEKDSPLMPLLFLAVIFLLLLGGGLGLAYIGGVFTGKNEVIANDKRIANLSHPPSAPSTAHNP
jgi:ABC-type transporter Mla subunit MlaD